MRISSSRLSLIQTIKTISSAANTIKESSQTETPGDQEANKATQYVAEGIYDAVALVAQRCSFRTVAIDDEVGIFEGLPQTLDRHCQRQLPD